MLVSQFDYELPPELIAQEAVEPRDHSRLMVIRRAGPSVTDHHFYDLPEFLRAGDLLVFNDTRVIPARLHGQKDGPDGARVEVFLLKECRAGHWECLVRPGKRLKVGAVIRFPGDMTGRVVESGAEGTRIIAFSGPSDFREWLHANGTTPLPPYITKPVADPERYQTVYGVHEGSVAAPTAGLHFTTRLLDQLRQAGIAFGYLTLNVGLGTFRPVQAETIEEHHMHSEFFTLPEKLVAQIAATKQAGGRIIAVGTTVVRVLESQARGGPLQAGSGDTDIFIYPGFQFRVIDGLVTNFHLPKSTLLMLVSALAGRELILESYRHAVAEGYRFFSFGDATLIL
jgi:S-adenosylmethionine:tRNA ribosyltransferase-isomerase